MARGSRSRVVGRVRSVLIVGAVLVAGMGGTARAESKIVPADDAYYVSNGDWYDEHLYAGHIPGRDNILAATAVFFGVESAVPPGAEIESATLRLYSVNGNGQLGAYRIEGTLPDTYDPTFSQHVPELLDLVPVVDGWNSWDVTDAVTAWIAGTEPNDGLAVYRRSGGWGAFDHVWAGATAPYLEVHYSSPNADPPQLWGRAPQAGAIRYEDVDADGAADAVLRTNSGSVMVALSEDHAYASFSLWGAWNPAWQLALADVDGNGASDLVGVDPASRAIMVAPSTGTAFETATGWGTWPSGYDANFTDADGDALADLIGSSSSTGEVRAAISTGTGFEAPVNWGSAPANDDVRFADVDGDEIADLVAHRASDDGMRVAVSTGYSLDPIESWGTVGSGQRRLADADGDGNADLWIRNTTTGDVLVRRSNGEAFTAASYWGNWEPERDFDAADADGDLRADAVGWNPSTRDIFVGLTTVEIPDGPPVEEFFEDPEVDYDDEDVAGSGGLLRDPDPDRVPRLAFQDDGVLVDRRGLSGDPLVANAQIQRLYDRIKQAGASVIRFNVIWGQTQTHPDAQGVRQYLWANLDRAVDEANARGFHVHLTITGVAAGWECDPDFPHWRACPPERPTGRDPDPAEYADFVGAVVRHFTEDRDGDGDRDIRVSSYSLWNEPNLKVFLAHQGGTVPAGLYRRLYRQGYDAATEAYSGARVFIGELSELKTNGRLPGSHLPRSDDRKVIVTAMDFLQEVTRPRDPDAGSTLTHGVAVHPYQHREPPHTAGDRWRTGVGKLNGRLRDPRNVRRGRQNLTGVNSTIDRLFKRRGLAGDTGGTAFRWLRTPGGRRPSLYLTEFGYLNKPQEGEHLSAPNRRTRVKNYWHTEARRANWLRGTPQRRGALEVMRRSRPKWILLYHLVEAPAARWDSGLIAPDGTVDGDRPYGKDPDGRILNRLDFSQPRRAYCAIWEWASSEPGEFGSPYPGWYDTDSNECGTVPDS
jgi:hypothetical protein